MPEEAGRTESSASTPVLRYVGIAALAIFALVSLYFIFELRGRVEQLEKANLSSAANVKELTHRLGSTNTELKASSEALASRLGMTEQEFQKSLASRAAQLEKQQRASEQRIQQEHQTAISQVTGEVAGVKADVGGAKTEIASTKSDLEATKQKLERAIGDLGVQSGLIARTRDDLETLKHRGDRNYYEFTLTKNAQPTPVGRVSIQLKKADKKKSRFSLNVYADDLTIEKKDRTVAEPLQFYTGRDRQLYELVVFTVEKDKVVGYVSSPK